VIFGAPRPIETMFYTAQPAYSAVPNRDTVTSLQAQGYEVVINALAERPAESLPWSGVEYVRLMPAD
jgi:hypothetical protein